MRKKSIKSSADLSANRGDSNANRGDSGANRVDSNANRGDSSANRKVKSANLAISSTNRKAKIRAPKGDLGESKSSSLSLKTLQIAEIFSSVESKREFAKLGMSASLLICVGSAFFKSDFAKNLHIASGVALVGFSIWHHSLYEK